MLKQIFIIVKLQKIDKTIFSLEQEQQAIPLRLTKLLEEKEQLDKILKSNISELESLHKRRRTLESDVEIVRIQLRKAESRFMKAKTQREYKAANVEIEETKDILNSNDDILLEIMERQEKIEKQIIILNDQLENTKTKIIIQEEQYSKRSKELVKIIETLQKERIKLAEQVEKQLLHEYDFIRKRRQGIAIAPVKNGVCQACHIGIPPQQFNELQRSDKVITCQSCKRLLYWEDALESTDI